MPQFKTCILFLLGKKDLELCIGVVNIKKQQGRKRPLDTPKRMIE